MTRVFLMIDYRGQFYSSTKHRGAAVDLDRLRDYFTKSGFELMIVPFSGVNFCTQNYKDEWVLYQSSEDPSLFYRGYLEDIVTGLLMQGAKLIPNFYQFKAHHNKHFMEIMRDIQSLSEIKNIPVERYGTYEDYLKDIEKFKKKEYVLKVSHTSKSRSVFLLKNIKEKIRLPKIISKTFSLQ